MGKEEAGTAMTFDPAGSWWQPFLFILIAGWLPTDIWRYLGVYFAGDLDEDAEILVFIRALATALVASVIAKLVLYPEGALALSPLWLRLGCVAAGFAAYWFAKRSVFVGVLTGEALLVGGMYAGL
jgi:Branched-chain amino acid transport protein (AzlD)